jgi:hypothetical protein
MRCGFFVLECSSTVSGQVPKNMSPFKRKGFIRNQGRYRGVTEDAVRNYWVT